MNSPRFVTCFYIRSHPGFIRKSSKPRPSQLCLFDAKMIFLPVGSECGRETAQPKLVISFAPLPSAVGHDNLHLHRLGQVLAQQFLVAAP